LEIVFLDVAPVDVASAQTIAKAAGFSALNFGKVQLFQSLLLVIAYLFHFLARRN
jgi:hypothetical protein